MLSLYIGGGLVIIIGYLFLKLKIANNKRKIAEANLRQAEIIIKHDKQMNEIKNSRRTGKTKRVEEKVNETIDNNFSDFFD